MQVPQRDDTCQKNNEVFHVVSLFCFTITPHHSTTTRSCHTCRPFRTVTRYSPAGSPSKAMSVRKVPPTSCIGFDFINLPVASKRWKTASPEWSVIQVSMSKPNPHPPLRPWQKPPWQRCGTSLALGFPRRGLARAMKWLLKTSSERRGLTFSGMEKLERQKPNQNPGWLLPPK